MRFLQNSPYNATPLLISIVHLFCSVLFIIYQVMLGCWVHTAFTLEYRGPFSCEPVPYLTAGCAAAVLVALLVAKICYKRKQNWTKMKSAQLQGQINRHMQYRQPQWSDFPIRSWYPGYLGSSRFPQVFYIFSAFIFSRGST